MRLPRIYDGSTVAQVDREKAYELIRYAADHGVNYFDTAFTYHHKTSEEVLGEALEGERRKRVKVVTKLPLHFMPTNGDIRRNLEFTLKKLRTDYLDMYLVHNIQPAHWPEIHGRGIYDEYVKLREEGLIRAIGFSYHGGPETFAQVLDAYPWDMCQVQQNLLDVHNEATENAIFLAGQKGTALVIMEPLRGGGLVTPPSSVQAIYDAYPISRKPVDWAFRHLMNYPEVSTILSGMTTMEQLKENIALFSAEDALPHCLSEADQEMLVRVRHAYEALASIPCTGCEYCLPCPQNVQIPTIFHRFNEGIMMENFAQPKRAYMLLGAAKKTAEHCVACGACEALCPQHIEIIESLQAAHAKLSGWVE